MFLRFQAKKAGVRRKLSWNIGKVKLPAQRAGFPKR
jgi:hypothetical protein